MKKTVFIISLLLLTMASCSKSIESNEKKYVKAMLDEDFEVSAKGFNDFCKWITVDRGTMTYDFPLMREKFNMKIASSADGQVRCYSWVTEVSKGIPSYANVTQWLANDRFVAYAGPLDQLIIRRKATIDNETSYAHRIDTIFDFKVQDVPVYLITQYYKFKDGMCRASVTATALHGIALTALPTFFDGIEIAGNNAFHDNGNISIGDLFKWDAKNGKLYAYQTDDKDNIIPGKYTVYVFKKDQFVKMDEQASDNKTE